ncbi:hypothetical protein V9T40_001041 [Parthenolecanium corni]|uniref:Transcription initiation factor TFIID subunit 5 n=1 Tax=Parthenolecanium corni TaxID=536013 RepID=A0AAN9TAN8_9HEMI
MDVDPSVPDLFIPPPCSDIVMETIKVESPIIEEVKPDIVETPHPSNVLEKNVISAVLQICKKYNLKKTEEALKSEVHVSPDMVSMGSDSDVNKLLSAYKSEGDPDVYKDSYAALLKFVENSLDIYKHELGTILYPMFVHMYLELVYNGYKDQAIQFMETYGPKQEDYYQEDIQKFAAITLREQMRSSEIVETFKSNAFIIRMSRDTVSILKRHLNEKDHSVLLNIIKNHLYLDMYEGVARNKDQIEITAGGMVGEARREDNKAKVFYGLLKEPDLQCFVQAEEDEDGDGGADADKPKKKKAKKDSLFYKKSKTDPNAPSSDRMPLPELKDADKLEKVKALRESSKRVTLSAETLPSICCYTLLNTYYSVSCTEISEDASMLAVGFADSRIKVWSLVPQKLKAMKSAEQLQDINLEADDVLQRIMEDRSAETTKTLIGHTRSVTKISFSPDKTLLVSSSVDGTVRLWSLLLWTCLVVYKGHLTPVWDVEFSPYGYYFVTGGHDKTARLWVTDQYQPVRVFVGHYSDVDCVKFHPNSNYVATGSSDRTVRLWDCVSGSQVRLMTGHKGSITVLCFAIDGRFLASAGTDNNILVWDMAHGHLLAVFSAHTERIETLAFSRDGNILVSGSQDCSIKLWDFTKFTEDISFDDISVCHNPDIKKDGQYYLLRTFGTKQSPAITLFFTRRNVLFAVTYKKSEE